MMPYPRLISYLTKSSNKPPLYFPLDFAVVRAPLLTVEAYLALQSEDDQLNLMKDQRALRAIAAASPSLLSALTEAADHRALKERESLTPPPVLRANNLRRRAELLKTDIFRVLQFDAAMEQRENAGERLIHGGKY